MRFAVVAVIVAGLLLVGVLALVGGEEPGAGVVPKNPAREVAQPEPIEPETPPAPKPQPQEGKAPRPAPLAAVAADPTRAAVVSAFEDIPIEGAAVQLQGSSDEMRTTDRHGQFGLPAHWAGGSVEVRAPGFRLARFALDAEGRPVESEAGSLALRLEPIASIRGRVIGPDRVPIDWVAITLGVVIPRGGNAEVAKRWPLDGRVLTKDGGEFEIGGLDPRGRYLVIARLSRLGIAAEANWVAADPVGERRTIQLGGDAEVRTIVVDRDGREVGGAKATLRGTPTSFPGQVAAAATGHGVTQLMREFRAEVARDAFFARVSGAWWRSGMGASFLNLPAGQYRLTVLAKGYADYHASFAVGKGRIVEHLATLEPAEIALRGFVVDDVNQPLAGAQLDVLTDGSTFAGYRTTPSDAQGNFVVRGPKDWRAPLSVRATATGHETRMCQARFGAGSVTIRLPRKGTVYGYIGFAGRTVDEIVFDFTRDAAPPLVVQRRLVLRGEMVRYQWDLPPGRWRARISSEGRRVHVEEFELRPAGDNALPNITMQPR